ncbi:MAG: hypothetical protein WBG65_08795 [Sulfurimonadaceae bacterium]
MAFWVLIGFIVVMVLVLLVQLFRKKPVKKLLLSYVLILGSYYLYVAYTCGPNSADVKVMKPQAEVITNYILKHGIPESLAEIRGLPYKLDRCKREMHNLERCTYSINTNMYEIEIYNLSSLNVHIYNEKSETGLRFRMKYEESNKKWILVEKNIAYSSKNNGICNPLRM